MGKNLKSLMLFLCLVTAFSSVKVSFVYGRGRNVVSEVTSSAEKYASYSSPLLWQTIAKYESADFIEYIGKDRALVGSVSCGSKLGIPRNGPVILYDTKTGAELWRANRPSTPEGTYRVLSTKQAIVIGSWEKSLSIRALNLQTGKAIWSFKSAGDSVISVVGSRIFCLDPKNSLLSCISLLSGKTLWKQTLRESFSGGLALPALVVSGEMVIVIGQEVEAFLALSGKSLWQLKYNFPTEKTASVLLDKGLCLWSAKNTLVIDTVKGKTLWHQKDFNKGLKGLYYADGLILRVLIDKGESDVVEALKPSTGKKIWARNIGDLIVSPLVVSGKLVLFTGDKAVYGIRKANGKMAFSRAFDDRFTKNTPSAAPILGAPDMLSVREGKLVVWRDRAGVMAVALPSGKNLWAHHPLRPLPDYNVNDATLLKFTVKNIKPKNIQSGGVIPVHKPGPNPFLIAAEKKHAQVMADKNSGSLDKRISGGAVMNAMEIDSAFSQAQAAVDVGVAMIGAAQAYKKMLELKAKEGLKQRYLMQSESIFRRKNRAFQGRYFLTPFLARGVGMGLTMVNLDTGKRADFLYSPLVVPLLDFSVDLLCYSLDETQTKLLTVGLGLNTKRYETMKKWQWRLPRPFVLAFDVNQLPFLKENRMRKVAGAVTQGTALSEEELQKIVDAAVALTMKAPSTVTDLALYEAVKVNNPAAVTAALDNGADVNGGGQSEPPLTMALREKRYAVARILIDRGADVTKPGAYKLTPLHFATYQLNLPLMKEFIAGKADVNAKNSQGLTPLLLIVSNYSWFTYKEKMLPAVELLLKNGAKTDLKTNQNVSLLDLARQQSKKLVALINKY